MQKNKINPKISDIGKKIRQNEDIVFSTYYLIYPKFVCSSQILFDFGLLRLDIKKFISFIYVNNHQLFLLLILKFGLKKVSQDSYFPRKMKNIQLWIHILKIQVFKPVFDSLLNLFRYFLVAKRYKYSYLSSDFCK